ncbi:NUDIX hydrolase [Ancylobacter sp. 6x-1]|uniref:NUDIX hydrolase n=1 Tax=Ancylobacter crimeensis TaxID=2579147 RepID=A0ABT0DCA7_9HYPH|nr:NUDIX hydrolase [Ancylobacter crimeensis]MCK0197595.1 NUDIX hydrolase [Ancylobacter crimeensis]
MNGPALPERTLAERLSDIRLIGEHPNRRPVDAATLILVDRGRSVPRVLLGRRHERTVFLPGKFVFPGGRVDPGDRRMAVYGMLDADSERRLAARMVRPSMARSRALALAAIRETCEETGLLIGTRDAGSPEQAPPGWKSFAEAGLYPDLEAVRFVARAITPPRLSRRFDTRFFMAEASSVAHRIEGIVGPEAELTELAWVSFAEARRLDLLAITQAVLDDVEASLSAPPYARRGVPFYYMRGSRFYREVLD